MSNTDLTVFRREGVDIRVVTIDGEPWCVLVDIAKALGLTRSASAIAVSLDDEVRQTYPIIDGLGRTQQATVISEPGVYEVIIRSDSPKGKELRHWITREVMPAIRKTGTYSAPKSELDIIREQHASIGQLLAKVEVDAPKVKAYDRFLDSSSLIKIEVAGRQAGIGRKTVFGLLRDAGVIQRYSRAPMQQYAHRFKEVASTHENSYGDIITDYTTKVRPEHFDWLVGRLEALAGKRTS